MEMKKSLDSRTERRKDMIKIYDKVRKIFITPTVVDMDYIPTYNKSDDEADDETDDKQSDTADMQ